MPDSAQIAVNIQAQIDALDVERAKLLDALNQLSPQPQLSELQDAPVVLNPTKPRKHQAISPEVRKKMAASQRKRYARERATKQKQTRLSKAKNLDLF